MHRARRTAEWLGTDVSLGDVSCTLAADSHFSRQISPIMSKSRPTRETEQLGKVARVHRTCPDTSVQGGTKTDKISHVISSTLQGYWQIEIEFIQHDLQNIQKC